MLPGLLVLVALASQTMSATLDTEGVPLAAAFSNSFVPKMFQALFPGRENLVFAPFGLSASLAMIMETLDTKAAEEARRVLRIRPEDKQLLRTGFRNILIECERALQEEEAAGTYNKITMLTAHDLSSQYFDVLTDSYRANVSVSTTPLNTTERVLSLQSDSGVMSHWKDYQRLAVYTYLSHEAAAPFTLLSGATVQVPMVPQVGVFRRGRLNRLNCLAVQLPLESRRVHLILLLPDADDGIDQVLKSLAKEKLLQMIKALPQQETEVTLPQLAILTSDLDLGPFIRQLGVRQLFTDPHVNVRSIKQNAYFSTSFVAVNSVGSISTELDIRSSGRFKRDTNKVVFNRPFLFFLVHSASDAILLAGVVQNPTQVPVPTHQAAS
ncbi:serpin I2 isoform X2 [Macrosteles quadrilineatus]|uniref:serpin I2 isoform X2 n=1 Tax=Macrosteles quadrilineatus TaxID=74068 RepID=UPI0023E2976B|nr:serpin I2 isoform X2 [Macrosteles quadrilineatus]